MTDDKYKLQLKDDVNITLKSQVQQQQQKKKDFSYHNDVLSYEIWKYVTIIVYKSPSLWQNRAFMEVYREGVQQKIGSWQQEVAAKSTSTKTRASSVAKKRKSEDAAACSQTNKWVYQFITNADTYLNECLNVQK